MNARRRGATTDDSSGRGGSDDANEAGARYLPRLQFMQSSGGLTDAHRFQGKDAILSGPAGGVVGAVEVSRLAGFDAIIGFDMGGTSTDVTHYAGEYERAFVTEVAGVRLRAPMMRIHTVAAGGGSICTFDGARFRVGPESAGADPGTRVVSPRRTADGHRLQRDGRQARSGAVSEGIRAGRRPAARCGVVRAKFAALAAEVAASDGPHAHAGGDRRGLSRDCGRQHGECDQAHLGRARLRRHRIHAVLLRWRRRPARVPRRRRARHDARAAASLRRRAVGLWHGARRRPRAASSRRSRRGSRRLARRDRSDLRRARTCGAGRSRRAGHPAGAHRREAHAASQVRRHRHDARNGGAPTLPRHRRRVRAPLSPALRVPDAGQAAGDRGAWRSRRWVARTRRARSPPAFAPRAGALRPLVDESDLHGRSVPRCGSVRSQRPAARRRDSPVPR